MAPANSPSAWRAVAAVVQRTEVSGLIFRAREKSSTALRQSPVSRRTMPRLYQPRCEPGSSLMTRSNSCNAPDRFAVEPQARAADVRLGAFRDSSCCAAAGAANSTAASQRARAFRGAVSTQGSPTQVRRRVSPARYPRPAPCPAGRRPCRRPAARRKFTSSPAFTLPVRSAVTPGSASPCRAHRAGARSPRSLSLS